MRTTGARLLVLAAALLLGAGAWAGWAAWQASGPLRHPLAPLAQPGTQHTVQDCAALQASRSRVLVLLVLGQSNAANHAQSRAAGGAGVYSWYRGRCYAAVDPLPGATGTGGSVWTRLGPLLVQGVRGRAHDAVLWVPLAIDATSVAQWARHPRLVDGLQDTVRGLRSSGFEPAHVLWLQGEAEAFKATSAADYRRDFGQVLQRLRELGVQAPVWVAQASLCQQRSNPAVRAAQALLPQQFEDVKAGPDMDALFAPALRFDGCHFSTQGAAQAAQAWWQVLSADAKP